MFQELETLFAREKEGWEKLKSPYEGVDMEINKKGKDKKLRVAIGRAEGTADCTAEEAAAWYFDYCSRERMAIEHKDPARLEIRTGEERENEKIFATVKMLPFPLNKRQFVSRLIWSRKSDKTIAIAVVSVEIKLTGGGISYRKLVRGQTKAIFTATNAESKGEIPQCKIVLLQYLDAGVHLPAQIVNKKIPLSLSVLQEINNSFNRDDDVDRDELTKLANIIKNEEQDYDEKEKRAIKEGKNL